MKAEAKHAFWIALIAALQFLVVMVFSSWFGAKEWSLSGVDAWLVLDRATILSSFVFTAIAFYGLRPDGWVRKLVSKRNTPINEGTEKILKDTNALIMLYFNSDAAHAIVDLFGPHIDLLYLVTSAPKQGEESRYNDPDSFLKDVKEKFGHLHCAPIEFVADKNDLSLARDAVMRAIAKAELQSAYGGHGAGKITCDLTGASKPMSFGMLEAAKEKGILVVYTDARRDANDRIVPKTQNLITIAPRASAPAS